jgi:hypothetical protein
VTSGKLPLRMRLRNSSRTSRAARACRRARGRDIAPHCVTAATAVCRRYDLLTRQREVSDVSL